LCLSPDDSERPNSLAGETKTALIRSVDRAQVTGASDTRRGGPGGTGRLGSHPYQGVGDLLEPDGPPCHQLKAERLVFGGSPTAEIQSAFVSRCGSSRCRRRAPPWADPPAAVNAYPLPQSTAPFFARFLTGTEGCGKDIGVAAGREIQFHRQLPLTDIVVAE